MASSYTCKKGWVLSQAPEDGTMVPFFINTRSKDMHLTIENIADWSIRHYNSFIDMNRLFTYQYNPMLAKNQMSFTDASSGYGGTYVGKIVIFPYILYNDSNFSVNLSYRLDNNFDCLQTSLSYSVLYSTTSKDYIYGIIVHEASATTNLINPSYKNYIDVNISGKVYSEINNTITAYYSSGQSSTPFTVETFIFDVQALTTDTTIPDGQFLYAQNGGSWNNYNIDYIFGRDPKYTINGYVPIEWAKEHLSTKYTMQFGIDSTNNCITLKKV